jgi:hypothetical protein
MCRRRRSAGTSNYPRRTRACATTRVPARTTTRIVPRRAAARGKNVTAIRFARTDTKRDPCPRVREPTFERQLTRTRPPRASVPATRNLRPSRRAVTFVRTLFGEVEAGGGTVTDANAALCGPPFPCLSTRHSRTE